MQPQQHQYHHQQTSSMPSLQQLIAVHQKQWQEHLIMTGDIHNMNNPPSIQQNNYNYLASNTDGKVNSNNYSPQQYTMQQQQYHKQHNTSHSSMNLTNYKQQQPKQQQVQNNMPQQQNRSHIHRRHRRFASMGHIKMPNNNNTFSIKNNNNNINNQQIQQQQHQSPRSMQRKQKNGNNMQRTRYASMGHLKMMNLVNNNAFNTNNNNNMNNQQQQTRNNGKRTRVASMGHIKLNNNNNNHYTINNQRMQQQHKQQQQAGNNKNKSCRNRPASTGQLKLPKNDKDFISQNDDGIEQLDEKEEDEEESMDHELAKRNGISEQKQIDQEEMATKCLKMDSFDFDGSDIYDITNKSDTVIYESWLSKKGKINKSMQVRYCIAYKDRKLKYFKKTTDKEAAGYIDLCQVSMINMYLPKLIHSKKNDVVDLNKLKSDGIYPMNIKSVSLKGNNNKFGFELVTNKRIWVFSCRDSKIFKKWMEVLRNICFGKSLYSGYLMKIGQINKNWKRRFFVLYDLNEMRYFENETMSTQKGKIELSKVTNVLASKPKQYVYTNCIELHTKERIWILATQTRQERESWMNQIY